MTSACTVIALALANKTGVMTSMRSDYWTCNLPLSPREMNELREKAIEGILQHSDLRARNYRREHIQGVIGFYVLVADADGNIRDLYSGKPV